MKKNKTTSDEMRPEYRREDLGEAIRGKYFATFQKGSTFFLVDPGVAKACSTSEGLKESSRGLLRLTEQTKRSKSRAARTRAKGGCAK